AAPAAPLVPEPPVRAAVLLSDGERRLLAQRPEIEDAYALAPLQQGMLFHTLKQPEGLHFRSQICFRLDGHLDPEIFQHAWETAAARHSALRTAFVWEAVDQPLQVVFRQVELPFERLDLRHLTAEERERQVQAIWQADREEGFELTQAPLMRFHLIRTGEMEHRLLWTYHHLLLDGWSLGILTDEVLALYEARRRGEEAVLPAPGLYRDFIAHLQRQDLAPAEQFWRQQLAGFSAPTPLGIDHAPEAGGRLHDPHGTQEVRLTATTTATLKSLARDQELTLNVLMQGLWAVLLSHYSGQREVLFAMAVSGRPAELAGVESTVGLFIHTVPVRADVPPQAPLLPWLRELQQRHSAILQHQLTPPLLLRRWAGVPAGTRFYESFLVFQNYPAARVPPHGRTLDLAIESTRGATETPLSLVIDPAAELSLRINYDRGRLRDDTVARTLGHLQTMLASVAADPDQVLGAIPFLTEAERRELLAPSAATAPEPPELDLDRMSDEDVERMLAQLLAAEPKEA
ncbi:MAG TPA: condensation domain-containing protein, partial [Thermoanaerobaculia bacterium]|nr:condensation domain-containing protein [Thermoanaerobaculia bacterium]